MPTQQLDLAKRYIRDLVSGGLLAAEAKKVAAILVSDPAHWLDAIKGGNLLQKKSPNTAIRYAQTIKRRLEALEPGFLEAVAEAEDPLYSQLLMLSLIVYTPVAADFMAHTVAETRRVYKPNLAMDAWDVFLSDRRRTLPGLEQLSASTLKKTGSNLIRALVEAGYLDNNKNRRLQPVYVLPETKVWLHRLGREDLAAIMECTL